MSEKKITALSSSDSQSSNMLTTFRPFRGPFLRWPRLSETVLIIAVFLASVFVPSDNENDKQIVLRALSDVPILVIILIAIASVSLFWRKSQPIKVLVITLIIMSLSTGLGYSFDFFGAPILMYSIGRYEINKHLNHIGAGGAAIIAIIQLFDSSETLSDIGAALFILCLSWYIGFRIRARGEYLRLLQERAEQLEREKIYESQRAVAAERARIARELHDVVAHQVSLMTVQAGAAKTIAGNNLPKAIMAMEAVENAGRQALVELRHLLGIIRIEEESEQLSPQPGLTDIPKLVDGFRKAGLPVNYSVDSINFSLPIGIDLTIYRIIQEALTNVIKHAGDNVIADVKIAIDNNFVSITISDNGIMNINKKNEHVGYGIIGMRERISLLSGSFEAITDNKEGFKIVCRIPI